MLIIPDVHQKMERLEQILIQRKENERIIFLGDFFDDFHDTPQAARRMAQELVMSLSEDWRACLGNHDLQYIFPTAIDTCAGFTPEKRAAIQAVINPHQEALLQRFAIFHRVGPWLLSHAGLAPHFHVNNDEAPVIAAAAETWSVGAMARAAAGLSHALFHIGLARGGFRPIGGPLWCDWDYEFADNHALPPQIVGHTPSDEPRRMGRSWNLDTHLNHFARIWEPPAPAGLQPYSLTIYTRGGDEVLNYSPPPPLSELEK